MAVPEITSEAQRQAEASVAGPVADIVERLGEKLGGKASVSAVFGEPVEHGGVTIIPVAKVSFGFGFGFGFGAGRENEGAKTGEGRGEGSGGGGGASASPVGYIQIRDGSAVFKPIRDPLVDVLVPLVALTAGSAVPRLVRGLLKLRRTRTLE